ncbi:MAG: hypothetical protein ABR519_10245, partial [Bacteroidales bacterium]
PFISRLTRLSPGSPVYLPAHPFISRLTRLSPGSPVYLHGLSSSAHPAHSLTVFGFFPGAVTLLCAVSMLTA